VDPAGQSVLVGKWRARLTPAKLAGASAARGRATFLKTCGACHRLFGEGGEVGPDLTGSGRANLEYLLENIVTPSAVVPADYRATVATLSDGRTVTGLLRDANARTVTLVTQGAREVLERRDLSKLETLDQSLMPEGLLDGLAEDEARDLVAYLMRPTRPAAP
jgi:putative heme-binding domain-containing protein